MIVTSRDTARLIALLAVAALVGCGGADVPMQKTVKVSGQVLLDGKPVEGLDIRFLPKDKSNFKLDETPLGRTDAAGKFTLTTYYNGDGAPPGEYLLAVSYPDQVPVPEEADETATAIAAAKAKKERAKDGKPRFPQIYSGAPEVRPRGDRRQGRRGTAAVRVEQRQEITDSRR